MQKNTRKHSKNEVPILMLRAFGIYVHAGEIILYEKGLADIKYKLRSSYMMYDQIER